MAAWSMPQVRLRPNARLRGLEMRTRIQKFNTDVGLSTLLHGLDHDHEELGSGSFGTVYASNTRPDQVIKVGRYDVKDADQDGWVSYVRALEHLPDDPELAQHAMRVYSLKLYPTCYAARIERLQPHSEHGNQWPWAKRPRDYSHKSMADFGDWLAETLDMRKYRFDLHGRNIMFRGNVPVYADPVFGLDLGED